MSNPRVRLNSKTIIKEPLSIERVEEDEESNEMLDETMVKDESMELPTTVTIVEEDGSTSVVEDASVSSILTDAGPNSSIQFAHSQGGGLTYRVVGMSMGNDDESSSYAAPTSSLQVVSNGQYYVISPPSDSIGRSPQVINRIGPKSIVRDEKKRATHNEVERRRRDKINSWIAKLSKIVPTCNEECAKASQSKGGILAKACEYIHELRNTNVLLAGKIKEGECSSEVVKSLRREIQELKRENVILKQQLGCPLNGQILEAVDGSIIISAHEDGLEDEEEAD